jgi:hypothetical protein
VRLLAWNIRQGGGSRLVGIMEAIIRHDADVLILSDIAAVTRPSGCGWRWSRAGIGTSQSLSRHRSAPVC